MKLFNKKNQDEIMYQTGYDDAEKKLIPEWTVKLAELENQKSEEIKDLEFEINKLNIQLKGWQEDHEKSIQREIDIRQRESRVKTQENDIKRFKEEVRDEITNVMAKNQEKFQRVLKLIGEDVSKSSS